MFKIALLLTGILSFIYFLKPTVFEPIKTSGEKVLGVKTLNKAVNIGTVKTALTIYCIDKGELPVNLNDLYEEVLSKDNYIDLNTLFKFEPEDKCEFNLSPK